MLLTNTTERKKGDWNFFSRRLFEANRFGIRDKFYEQSVNSDEPNHSVICIYNTLCFGVFIYTIINCLIHYSIYPDLSRDSCSYIENVNSLLQGQDVSIEYPLLFNRLISLGNLWGFDTAHFGLALNIVSGAMLTIVGIKMAFLLFNNRWIAILAGFIIADNPSIIALSCQVQREMLYLLFSMVGIYFSVLAIKNRKAKEYFFSGIFTGLACCVRYEALELFFLISLFLFMVLIKKKIFLKIAVFELGFWCILIIISTSGIDSQYFLKVIHKIIHFF